jgi:outer membrane protein assembly factor BamD
MLKKPFLHVVIAATLILIVGSCSKYQKLLKSSNTELKYQKAIEYYNNEDYYRALQLFDMVLPYYRGTSRAEKIGYYISMSHYFQGDYILASYHFKNFAKTFPKSKYAKECTFLAAYCNYLESPRYSLDQSNSYKAIEGFQYFANQYPRSDSVELCNEYIDELRDKLQRKRFEISKQYLKTEYFEAAITSFKTDLEDYPNSEYKEESLFFILKSHFLLAENSIEEKKYDRYKNTEEAYERLVAHYGKDNTFAKQANKIYEKTLIALEELKKQRHLSKTGI